MNTLIKFCFVLLLACTEPLFAATVTVDITNFKFTPASVTVDLGDTVKWVNNDSFSHTTTGASWNATLAHNQTFSRVFSTEGSYSYRCNFHSSMTATVVVRSPEQTRINTGKNILNNIVPIKLNLTGKNANLAHLGSYIVNVQAGCANCHSCSTYKLGNNPYLGQTKKFNAVSYLAGGVKVSGGGITALSANITPDATGKPAGLSLKAFKNLLRTGSDPEIAGALLPVMPWPIFGMMSDNDLNAVYEYLRSIPTATTPTTQCADPGQ